MGQLVVPDHMGSPTRPRCRFRRLAHVGMRDSWSRAEHVAFEAIDTCIVWLT